MHRRRPAPALLLAAQQGGRVLAHRRQAARLEEQDLLRSTPRRTARRHSLASGARRVELGPSKSAPAAAVVRRHDVHAAARSTATAATPFSGSL